MKSFKVCFGSLLLIGVMSNFSYGQMGTENGGVLAAKAPAPGPMMTTLGTIFESAKVCGDTQCWTVYGFVCLNNFDGTFDEAEDQALFFKFLEIDWLLGHYDFVCNWSNSEISCFFEVDFETLNVYLVKECKLTVVFRGDPVDPDDVENDPLGELLMDLIG